MRIMKKKLSYFVIILLAGTFYYMNALEPLRCDDLIYQFFWLDERASDMVVSIDLDNRVESFSEAFYSQVNHYFVMNGRFLVHFFVSCFCGFLGRPVFSILNVAVYVMFLLGCIRLLELKSGIGSATTIILLWLGLPIQYIFWYSIAFAINYLWTSTALLYFLILYKSQFDENRNGSLNLKAMLFVLSFVVGSLHEGFSLPLSGAVFFNLLINRHSINSRLLSMAFGLWLGTVFVVFAPGTIGRASGSISGTDLSELIMMKLDVLRYSKRFYLFIFFFVVSFFVYKERFVGFLRKYQIEMFFIVLDFIMVLGVPHYSQRIEFPLEMLSLLLSIYLFINSKFWEKTRRYVCVISVALLIPHLSLTAYYAKKSSAEYTEMIAKYLNSPNGNTCFTNYTVPKVCNSYVHRLDKGIEREFISFVYGKEMVIDN